MSRHSRTILPRELQRRTERRRLPGRELFLGQSQSCFAKRNQHPPRTDEIVLSRFRCHQNSDNGSPRLPFCWFDFDFDFAFASQTTHTLSIEEATRGLELLREAGTEKINFAGGEPFVRPHLLGRLCQKAHELGMAVSIISNGSLITEEWMKQYGYYVDVLGVSVDSFDPSTNAKIGRGGDSNNQHVQRMLRVRQWCRDFHIKFKVNTVVCKHNMEEDMTQKMLQLDPVRWKIFQVLVLKGENAGAEHGDLRDATALTVTGDEYRAFVDRHRPHFSERVLVPESNEVMQNSYLLLDEDLCFLDCSDGGKVPGASILDVGVEAALLQAGFDFEMFHERGGIYDWSRDRSRDEPDGRLRP